MQHLVIFYLFTSKINDPLSFEKSQLAFMTDFAFRICVSIDEKPTPHVNSHSNESLTSSCHQFQFPELKVSCVPMCSRGVLRGGKSDRATADGDDELHPRLPHLALGRHGDALLETPLVDCCPCHSSHSCWIQVS